MNKEDDLFLSSTIGDLIWLKSCVEQDGLNPQILRNKHGFSCLHLSALNARPKCVEYLLGRGLSSGEIIKETGCNTFHLTVQRKNGSRGVQTLRIILSSLYHTPPNAYLDQQNNLGKTPLHLAMSVGCIAYIKLLLKANARTDIRDEAGNLPIDLSKVEGHYEAMRLLQAHQWALDKNRKQHYMLVSKNRELLDNRQQVRTSLEDRQKQSSKAYIAWAEKKSLPLLQENRLYPDSGPKNTPPSLTKAHKNLRANKEISLSLEQKKHNLTIYKHTQPPPAPLVIRATSALKRYKVWLPAVAMKSAPTTRHHRRESLESTRFSPLRPFTQGRMSVRVPMTTSPEITCNSSLSSMWIQDKVKTTDQRRYNAMTRNSILKEGNEKQKELMLSKLPVKTPIRIQNFIFPDSQPDLSYEDYLNLDSPRV